MHLKIFGIFFLIYLTSYTQYGYNIIGNSFGVNNINNAVCGEVDSCFTLTPDAGNQSGAVWDNKLINLNYGFDASFCMTLGSNDQWGADGFAFVMRGQNSDSLGVLGSGIGYQGISPSVAIEFDTWYNDDVPVNDITQDHTGLYINSNYANPGVPAISLRPNGGNVEDGGFHVARIVWNPSTNTLQMYFDGNLRITYVGDIINDVFGGENEIIWGFTASTGGATNLQQICFPKYQINLQDLTYCEGETAIVSFFTPNMTSYRWEFEDGTVLKNWNTLDFQTPFDLNDTTFTTTQAGTYRLFIEINNQPVEDSLEVSFVPNPEPVFINKHRFHCYEEGPLQLNATGTGLSYLWSTGSTAPTINTNQKGEYFVTRSPIGANCPTIDSITIHNLCEDTIFCSGDEFLLSFYTENMSSYTWTLNNQVQYSWSQGTFNLNDSTQLFNQAGAYVLTIGIEGENIQDTVNVSSIQKPISPFNNTALTICLDAAPYVLDAQNQGSTYLWNTNDTTQMISTQIPGVYTVSITEPNNTCTIQDNITLFSVCQTIIEFPNVFTPNQDLENEFYTLFLSNSFEWIEDFHFMVVNRWGNVMYEVNNELPKWDGNFNDSPATPGVYFYKCSYIDKFTGELQEKHGDFHLIR